MQFSSVSGLCINSVENVDMQFISNARTDDNISADDDDISPQNQLQRKSAQVVFGNTGHKITVQL